MIKSIEITMKFTIIYVKDDNSSINKEYQTEIISKNPFALKVVLRLNPKTHITNFQLEVLFKMNIKF